MRGLFIIFLLSIHPVCFAQDTIYVDSIGNALVCTGVNITNDEFSWTINRPIREGALCLEHLTINNGWWPNFVFPTNEFRIQKDTSYNTKVHHISGVNYYRIKFLIDDKEYYSPQYSFNYTVPLKIKVNRRKHLISFSRVAEYRLDSESGGSYAIGKGMEVDASKFRKGRYILRADNQFLRIKFK